MIKRDCAVKGAAYAAQAIQMVASGTRRRSARMAVAKAACGPHGNYTDEAKAMWREYLESGAPEA